MLRLPKCLISWFGWALSEAFWLPSRTLRLGPVGATRALFINLARWWRVERWRVGFLPPGVHAAGRIDRDVDGSRVSFFIRLVGGPAPVALVFAVSGGQPIGLFLVRGSRASKIPDTPMPDRTPEGVPFRLASNAEDVLAARLPPSTLGVARRTLSWLDTILS